MIAGYVFAEGDEAMKKGEQLLAKLIPLQAKIGIVGILVESWSILSYFLIKILSGKVICRVEEIAIL